MYVVDTGWLSVSSLNFIQSSGYKLIKETKDSTWKWSADLKALSNGTARSTKLHNSACQKDELASTSNWISACLLIKRNSNCRAVAFTKPCLENVIETNITLQLTTLQVSCNHTPQHWRATVMDSEAEHLSRSFREMFRAVAQPPILRNTWHNKQIFTPTVF